MASTERKSTSEEDPELEEKDLVVGAAVVLQANDRAGIIRYRGPIKGEDGVWLGVECLAGDKQKGGTNGVRAQKRYFFAPQGRAVFCQAKDVKKVLSKQNSKTNFYNNVLDPAERLEAVHPKDWNANDVARWLQKIGALDCITRFLVHNVTGSTLIKLTDKDLEKKYSIKNKDDKKLILSKKEEMMNSREKPTLPNLAEEAELKTSLDDDLPASDTILQPPLTNFGEAWRLRSKSNPIVKKSPRKRDSYSVPENLRSQMQLGQLGRRGVSASKLGIVHPPARGSFRGSEMRGLIAPTVTRFHSTPVVGVASDRQQLAADRESDEYIPTQAFGSTPMLASLSEQSSDGGGGGFVNVSETDGADSAKGHKRSGSLTKFIENNPMNVWTTLICSKWINSLGGKSSSYGTLFREKKVTGAQLEKITSEALAALGVKEAGVRKWILTQRDTLLRKNAELAKK